MHRDPLLELVRDYAAKYPEEEATVHRFEEFIHRCPDCFERSLQEGHITGSAWLVDQEEKRVLFTHHRKLNKWIQLGGHADGDSDVPQVALKEATEESGLDQLNGETAVFDIDIHPIPARKTDPEHLHYDVRFVIKHDGEGEFVVSDESHDLAWLDINEIQTVTTEESVLRMQRKWKSR